MFCGGSGGGLNDCIPNEFFGRQLRKCTQIDWIDTFTSLLSIFRYKLKRHSEGVDIFQPLAIESE